MHAPRGTPMRYTPMRYMLMRCMALWCTPIRCTPGRCMPMRYMPLRFTPNTGLEQIDETLDRAILKAYVGDISPISAKPAKPRQDL